MSWSVRAAPAQGERGDQGACGQVPADLFKQCVWLENSTLLVSAGDLNTISDGS
jgi:hypothetical protein